MDRVIRRYVPFLVVTFLILMLAPLSIHAGDLEPPGPPGPTMKTLGELEPRIPIFAEQLPLMITVPGSYYFAENIEVAGGGITVAVDDVTIDLMGYTLAGGTGDGISAQSLIARVRVLNGIIRDWEGIGVSLNDFGHIEGVVALSNGGGGVSANYQSRVLNSTASHNDGIGISLWSGIVRECHAEGNLENGIYIYTSGHVIGCAAYNNTLNGIRVDTDSIVMGNICTANGTVANAKSGILATSHRNRIEGNNVTQNMGHGIWVDGLSNVIVRNSAVGNVVGAYHIPAGNDPGPIGKAATATSPWANFTN